MKKKILDLLYPLKADLAFMSNEKNVISYQLPENDISGRNIACGESNAYGLAAKKIDDVINSIINLNE